MRCFSSIIKYNKVLNFFQKIIWDIKGLIANYRSLPKQIEKDTEKRKQWIKSNKYDQKLNIFID